MSEFSVLAEKKGFEYDSRVFAESPNFVAFPGLGPLTEAYVLIVPRHHYLSSGALPEALILELQHFKSQLWNYLLERHGSVIAFEHGPATSALKAGCCVDHAHVHLIAPGIKNIAALLSRFFSLVQIDDMSGLRQVHEKGLPYIWLETTERIQYVAVTPRQLPSQFVRRVLATEIGVEDWDWRTHPKMDEVLAIFEELRDGFRTKTICA